MADLLTVKILLNRVILTPKAKFMALDIKKIYLNTPLKWYKYLWLKIEGILKDVKQRFKLSEKVMQDRWVYVTIRKGIYGLPQTRLLFTRTPGTKVAMSGYTWSKHSLGLWTHNRRSIQFCLIVDKFGVKYIGKENIEHLKWILKQHYELSTDWMGAKYVRLMIEWD